MHLFMITSWNKIGINIGDLFLFLAFDPEDEKWHPIPPPPRTPFYIYNFYHRVISSSEVMTTEQCLWCPWRSLNKWDCNKQQFAQGLLECPDRPKLLIAVGHFSHINFDHERYHDQSEYLDLSPIKRSVARCHGLMNVWRYEEWAGNLRMSRATGTVPERVQSRVHTTEPTGPVPEPFHCDHIARWSARSGTTGRSGTGVNTGARLRSGTVPVPNVWCEHGLSEWNRLHKHLKGRSSLILSGRKHTRVNVSKHYFHVLHRSKKYL